MEVSFPYILWFPLALAAALAFAGHNGLGKTALKKLTPVQLTFSSHLIWSAVMTFAVLVSRLHSGGPLLQASKGFLPALLTTSILNVLAFTLLFAGIRSSPLSISVPYLSLTPVFILLTGPVIVGEVIGPAGAAAVLSVAAGSWMVQSRTGDTFTAPLRRIFHERGPRNVLGVALIFSVSAVVDKVALIHSDLLTFLFATAWCRTALLLPVFINAGKKTPISPSAVVKAGVKVGLLFAAEGFAHMSAIALGPVAYVVAVKRTSILFSVLLGFYAFGERKNARLVAGIILMVGGAIVLSLLGG
jgi:uncharacterized membrane protein